MVGSCSCSSVHSWIHGASRQVIGCVICSSVMLSIGILLSLVVGTEMIWRYMRSMMGFVIPRASSWPRQTGSQTNMWWRLR